MKYTTLSEFIKNNDEVVFVEYRKGNLWYTIWDGEAFMDFPVPIEDTGDGIFKDRDRTIYFMRYIRKHLEEIAKAL
jgi:hypothetical protein